MMVMLTQRLTIRPGRVDILLLRSVIHGGKPSQALRIPSVSPSSADAKCDRPLRPRSEMRQSLPPDLVIDHSPKQYRHGDRTDIFCPSNVNGNLQMEREEREREERERHTKRARANIQMDRTYLKLASATIQRTIVRPFVELYN